MVHLIRNSIKYVPSKDYKVFTSSLKKAYGAPTLKACKSAFETFRQQWSQYPGVVGVWVMKSSLCYYLNYIWEKIKFYFSY